MREVCIPKKLTVDCRLSTEEAKHDTACSATTTRPHVKLYFRLCTHSCKGRPSAKASPGLCTALRARDGKKTFKLTVFYALSPPFFCPFCTRWLPLRWNQDDTRI